MQHEAPQQGASGKGERDVGGLAYWFYRRSRLSVWAVGICAVLAIGLIDYFTGEELSLSIFYLLPIALVSWSSRKWDGILVSALSAGAWYAADVYSGHAYSHYIIPVWNAAVRLAFFVTTSILISVVRTRLEQEKVLARKDFLTGAVSSRGFYELVQKELERAGRYKHPFSLAYIDLDNFKVVNDTLGHLVGGHVLRVAARVVSDAVRSTDTVARLGGDEFAVLLPETGQESARAVISRLIPSFMKVMQESGWPVTLSIGVVTFISCPASVDEAVKRADDVMYEVKNAGKNNTKYELFSDSGAAAPRE